MAREINHNNTESPTLRKVLYSVEESAKILSLGRTTLFALIRERKLKAVKVGSRRLIAASELEAFAARMGGEA